jgi:hypothetical protein
MNKPISVKYGVLLRSVIPLSVAIDRSKTPISDTF